MQRKWKIHKSACLICVIGLLIYCGPKGDKVERYMQDGTEVVLNHSEPYSLEGAKAVYFEEVLTIDTEKDETAGMGLTDISHMDVDSEGNIFIVNQKAQEIKSLIRSSLTSSSLFMPNDHLPLRSSRRSC